MQSPTPCHTASVRHTTCQINAPNQTQAKEDRELQVCYNQPTADSQRTDNSKSFRPSLETLPGY